MMIEQYLAFESPDGYRDELINGKIIVSPEAKPLHSDVADNLYGLLKAASNRKLHRVSQRRNLRFPDVDSMPSPDVFVIDLAEWQRARSADTYPDGAKVLLAVEVISPSNRPAPLAEKVAIYVNHGIETWVVEPKKQQVKLHRQGVAVQSESLLLKSVLQWNGHEIPLQAIFQLP
jgi:Uma2 family endonuclease